jgi:hypothetical protein
MAACGVKLPAEINEAIDEMLLTATWAPYPTEGGYQVRIVSASDEERVQEATKRLKTLIIQFTDAGDFEAKEDAAIRALLGDDEGDW